MGVPVDFDLTARYRAGTGPTVLTGVQAVGRLLAEQHAADARAGLHTASFVSGYPGSPLGGLDQALAAAPQLREAGMHLVPAVNEELAATAVWGSQLEIPGRRRRVDGVVGVWYGKGPGVDRAGDAFRHGNVCGAHPCGGVLVLAGDDPGCKSSTIPCISERTLAGYHLPVLFPGDAAELIRLGRYGIAASRASGCWIGMKIVADVADGVYALDAEAARVDVTVPELEWERRPWTYRQHPLLLPPESLAAEADLYGPRWAMLQAFAAANPINTVEVDPPSAWLGLVAGGKTFGDLRQALRDLGLGEGGLRGAGVRLLRLGMIHPLERDRLRRFAAGLERVLVIEEKPPFIESAVRDALYGMPDAPAVDGGDTPVGGELNAGLLTAVLRRVLAGRVELPAEAVPRARLELLPVARTPYFCSGCPHSRSTLVPEGSVAGGGIGCHAMVALAQRPGTEVTALTQMGGEGAQWIGQAAFTDVGHLFQNMGDGTFAHSGQMAVQACVAAGVTITFKLLYNRAVAMTGGQDASGGLEVPALTRKLTAEGVARIIVCAEEPEAYGGVGGRASDRRRVGFKAAASFAPGVQVWHRSRLDEAQRALREVPGVTVLIYDQRCAAESRRLRKRGRLPARRLRVVINEAVCEGCGDCGAKSNCLSVQPIDTELGRKTRIDQGSCNTDYACLDGDCPSFVTVEAPDAPGPPAGGGTSPEPPAVPDPPASAGGREPIAALNVFLAGIGGTGVVTVNQVLAHAAVRAGLAVRGVDQTGLSQKAGPVTSHLRITAAASPPPANRISHGQADCYLAFDLLVGADARNLAHADPGRTVAVVCTGTTPTGAMVRDPGLSPPAVPALLDRVRGQVRALVALDALAAARALFGDALPANLLLVGAAVQAGALPLPPEAIEWAIARNGVAVEANTAAFRWGRAAVADPDAFRAGTQSDGAAADGAAGAVAPRVAFGLDPLTGETRRLAAIRAGLLEDYQNRRTAEDYLAVLRRVWAAERRVGERTAFSEAAARGLHRVTAYKDEYEVARLLTDPAFEARLAAEVPGGRRLRYRLHPPLLRAMGWDRKLALGRAWRPVLKALAKGKVLRGTVLDPFGHTAVRRLERELSAAYRAMVERLAAALSPQTYDRATAAAEAIDLVRGYEGVKLASVTRYRRRLAELGLETAPSATPP